MAYRTALLLIAAAATLGACDWAKKKDPPEQKSQKELATEQRDRIRKACASEGTYDRLKELIFDEAARIRKSDPRNLDPLAAAAVVRMENPVVKSRDEALNVTVCTGEFILELPPGAENAFDGERRLTAEVEYAAQAALDGSGLVYQMDGAEPIIYRLAAVGMQGRPMPRVVAVPQPSAPPASPAEVAVVQPTPPPVPAAPQPAPRTAPPAAPPKAAPPERPATPTRVTVRPSFNCRYAKTRTERMVCGSPALAAQDREMASLYYALMAEADTGTRSHLRRSRDSFLSRRERCGSASCVAAAYSSRMAELRRVAQGG
ncbi:MAG TPA: hypothetical protein VGB59_09410 [Allosphingosinicella sp.]|jgi:uncharacterized protein YecT (DUF1311 family)